MVETIAPNVRSVTPSSLQAKMQATNMVHLIGQVSALRGEVDALRGELARRCANCKTDRQTGKPAVSSVVVPSEDALLRHLAGQLDAHATFGNALKARLNWVVDLSKATHAWVRDVLQPFNRSVDNRLRYLEMVVEETILASSPDLQGKLARIRQMIGTADLAVRETPPLVLKDDASSKLT